MELGIRQSQKGDLPVPRWLTEREPWYQSLRESFREVFGPRKVVRVKNLSGQPAPFKAPELQVNFGSWKESVQWTFNQIFRPEKLPPLSPAAQKIQVAEDSFETKEQREKTKRTHTFSLLAHAVVLLLVAIPFARQVVQAGSDVELVSLDASLFDPVMPPDMKKAGGGGGGGDRSSTPASQGRLPRFDLTKQLTAPSAVIKNPDPALAVEPTLLVDPNISIPSPDLPNLGDPLSRSALLSNGPGAGSGIGTGIGGGIGEGFGGGLGPGEGGNFGGGVFEVGGSVSKPACIHCPDPEYSEEARKAKYQGTVVLWAIIDENGRARNIRIAKSVGLGLDESAMRAVQGWIFRPARRFGKPVPVKLFIEVSFNIF